MHEKLLTLIGVGLIVSCYWLYYGGVTSLRLNYQKIRTWIYDKEMALDTWLLDNNK